jgi:3-methyladenine DNA glycosylase AlkD
MTLSVSEMYNDIIHKLELSSRPEAIEGMAKYGVTSGNAYGVSIPVLRSIAKRLGKNTQVNFPYFSQFAEYAHIFQYIPAKKLFIS